MIYYLLTQGTQSSDYSFILKNGKIIDHKDNSRNEILEKFQKIDIKSNLIYSENSRISIRKIYNTYLITVLTTNSDGKGRKMYVELLIESHIKNTPLKEDLIGIISILKTQNIILDESLWLSIPSMLKQSIDIYHENKILKYLIVGLAVAISIILLILILIVNEKKYLE